MATIEATLINSNCGHLSENPSTILLTYFQVLGSYFFKNIM